jgi:hypothetical protein
MTPEKIVEQKVLSLCLELGLDVDVIDSKATYSQKAKKYLKSRSAPAGISDLIGNNENGLAVWIELKALGKLNTIRPNQRAFLIRKIEKGCFACVVDSPELLSNIYLKFLSLPIIERPNYLKSILP